MITITNYKKIFLTLAAALIAPSAAQATSNSDFYQKVLSSLASSAIGDALGRVTEFIPSVDAQFKRYPHGVQRISDFTKSDWNRVPAALRNKNIAPYTDDTRMALLVCEALKMPDCVIKRRESTMAAIAQNFIRDLDDPTYGWAASYRAPGLNCLKSVKHLKQKTPHEKQQPGWWDAQSLQGGGCGSVMRAHPFGLVLYNNPEQAKLWAVEHSKITHGHPIALAACAAMAVGTAHALEGAQKPEAIILEMIKAAQEYDHVTAQKMRTAVTYATQAKVLLEKAGGNIKKAFKNKAFKTFHEKVFNEFQGWAAHDAIAATVYVFALFPEDIDAALFTGVHTPGDSDSIAAMAGALVGAYSGTLPSQVPLTKIEDAERFKEFAQRLTNWKITTELCVPPKSNLSPTHCYKYRHKLALPDDNECILPR